MIGLSFLVAIASADPAASVGANLSRPECVEIDEELRRNLAKAVDRLERRRTYFQLSQWACDWEGIFEAGWYSQHLEALKEPSFALRRSSHGYVKRIRLLVLPEHRPSYVIRIDYLRAGEVRIHFAKATGRGGDELGTLATNWNRKLSRTEGSAFLEQVERANVLGEQFNLRYPSPGPKAVDEDSASICIAGSPAIIELLDEKGRHTVAQTGCDANEAIYPVIDGFHALAGIEVFTAEPKN